MELQGRDLRVNTRGADGKLLHQELRKLGYTEIPQDKLSEQRFGVGTGRAVRDFQERRGLEPTAVVDAVTAARINAEIDKVTFTVDGKLVSRSRGGVGGLRLRLWTRLLVTTVWRSAAALTDERGGDQTKFTIPDLGQRGKRGVQGRDVSRQIGCPL